MHQTGSRYSNKPSASNMRYRACLSENRPRWMCSPCPGTQPAGGAATHTHTHRVLTSICKKNYSAKNFFSPPRNVFVFYSVSREEIQLQKKKNYFMTFLFHVWNRVGEKKFWQENFHISFTHMELRSKIAYVFFDETKMYFHSTSHKNSVVFFS